MCHLSAMLDESIQKHFNLDPLIAKLLYLRGFERLEQISPLFNPPKLINPMGFHDMVKIVDRIETAILRKEKVVICGDYDVDGTVSSAILVRYFRAIGFEVDAYIPHRIKEGYGISAGVVSKLSQYQLIITVDNGIMAFEAATEAKKLGVDLIITDHHDLSNNRQLPEAYAVLNPKIDNVERCKFLSGAGVALYLVNCLEKRLKKNYQLKESVALAMIASITDVVPLVDDNRIIVKKGLEYAKEHLPIGLRLLFESLGLDLDQVQAKDIGFRIGPILNAAGRLEAADKTLDLLLEEDEYKISMIIEDLKQINERRKAISNEAIDKYIDNVYTQDQIIVISDEIHQGVLGIVAARIKEKHNKPVIVIGFEDGENIGKASCRSVPGFNMKLAIEATAQFHLGGGGHYMAAGFVINRNSVDSFRKAINQFAQSGDFNQFLPEVDFDITIDDLTKDFKKQLESLEPFGAKFDYPMVNYRGEVSSLRILKNEHLLLTLDKKTTVFVFFADLSVDLNKYRVGNKVEIKGELSVQRGKVKIIASKQQD